MRSDKRNARKRKEESGYGLKNAIIAAGVILVIGLIAFFVTVLIYNNNLEKMYNELDSTSVGKKEDNNTSEEVSSTVGKSAEELEREAQNMANVENEEAVITNAEEDEARRLQMAEEARRLATETQKKNEENEQASNTEEANKTENIESEELSFEKPVEGEMLKEFAKDKLVYSETLKEWTTHMGVDIKAEKTTVVKAAENGKVTAIKNDPRYGITVIIEHANGYETRYANLLTAEFVTVGEEVTKGETIGTVGSTASFEVLDEPHLHFEILRNGEYEDPMMY